MEANASSTKLAPLWTGMQMVIFVIAGEFRTFAAEQ
jgi:hypothetical protein